MVVSEVESRCSEQPAPCTPLPRLLPVMSYDRLFIPNSSPHRMSVEVSGGELLLLTAGPLYPPPHTLTITCTNHALHRMSVEVSGVELLLRTAGPLLLERRGMAWELPRLAPGQRATRTVQLRVLG